jgi:hypothetical protein
MFKKRLYNGIITLILGALFGQMLGKVCVVVHFMEHRAEIADLYCHHETKEIEADCFGTCYLSAELDKHDHDFEKNPVKSLEKDELPQDNGSTITLWEAFLPPSVILLKKANFTYQTAHSRLVCLSIFRPPTV